MTLRGVAACLMESASEGVRTYVTTDVFYQVYGN